MHTLSWSAPVSMTDRMTVAVFVAVLVHGFLLLGVSFDGRPTPRPAAPALDIVLVQPSPPAARSDDAAALAQQNSDAGGDTPVERSPTSPLPTALAANRVTSVSTAPPRPPLDSIQADPQDRPRDSVAVPPAPSAAAVLASELSDSSDRVHEVPRPRARPRAVEFAGASAAPPETRPARESRNVPPPQPEALTAASLVNSGLAMASLPAEIDRRLEAYADKPRRKWISSLTREYRYAAYMEAWRAKVERVGNLNYPDEARRRHLSGKLQLDVALLPDGSVQRIVVRRSSGQKVLDDAAVRIVKLAAPYAPFPPNFRDDIDVLHIERTWTFLDSNRLAAN